MDVISNWLYGKRNYFVGLAIYKTVAKNAKLKDLFAKGPTEYNKTRLAQELSTIHQQPLVALALKQADTDTATMPESTDPVLKAIREEWLIPYQKMNYLRHQLDHIKGNYTERIAARKPIAFEILEMEQQCIQVWEKRRLYEKNGQLPNVPKENFVVPADPVLIGKFIEAAKKGIRNNRKKMKDHPDNPLYAQLYKEHKARFKAATGNDYEEKN